MISMYSHRVTRSIGLTFGVAAAGAFLAMILIRPAGAQSFNTGTSVNVAKGQTVDSSWYASGQNISVDGTVNGDVFCAGQNVTISGKVNGDVFCAGQNVRITGAVAGSVRLAGQAVSIEGPVTRSATMFAQTGSLSGGGKIGEDFAGFSQVLSVNGQVGRDLAAGANEMTITSKIGRDVSSQVTDRLVLNPTATVGRNVRYSEQAQLVRENGATINGQVTKIAPSRQASGGGAGFMVGFILYLLSAMLVISMALILLMPALFQRSAVAAFRQPGKAVLYGLAISFLAPALIFAVALTGIGIPLALTMALAYILALTLAGPTAAYLLGKLTLQRSRNAVLTMLVGSLILLVLYLIPFVNVLALFAALWFGLGSLALGAPKLQFSGYRVRPTKEIVSK